MLIRFSFGSKPSGAMISGLSCALIAIALHSKILISSQTLSPFIETIPGTSIKFEMIPLPAGTITLNKTAATIKPVWIGKTEVTWDEYDIYAFTLDVSENKKIGELDAIARPTKPYGAPDRGFGHRGYPALSMTLHAAQEYCRWLSAKTGKKYRLPTEAEWEYACRAGGTEKLSREKLDQFAWFWDNAENKTHPVAAKSPNLWGVYDMLGNAAEWVVSSDSLPVVAGGSFKDKAEKIHCGLRTKQTPNWNMTDPQLPKSKWWLSDATFVGFRVVCEP
jgi:formylglycine-generating enzyme required for sulfatase activity